MSTEPTPLGNLIYLAPHRWDTLTQRPQHLTTALAQAGWRVLHVAPVAHSLPGELRHRLRRQPATPWRGHLTSRAPRLWSFTPPPGLPLTMESPALNRLAHRLVLPAIRATLRRLAFRRPTLVVGWPLASPLVGHLDEAVAIYDCMDNFAAFPGSVSRRATLATAEQTLAHQVATIVATSAALQDHWRSAGCPTALIRNGVSTDFLTQAALPQPLPADLQAIPMPRLLYVGSIDRWLATDLLHTLCTAHPEWSLALIGPVQTDLGPLSALPNLHLLGTRPHSALPAYLAAADVCLIPFTISPLTSAVNPVKFYEYLAFGKPVVATPLPELLPFTSVCHLATDSSAFIAAISTALAESATDPRRAARQQLAATQTWQHRARDFTALVQALTPPGRPL